MSLNLINISDKIRKIIVFDDPEIKTPYHKSIKVIFADYTASGRPSPIIEEYIQKNVLPYYSNTHSNAYCGIKMKNMVHETKEYMRKSLNIPKCKKIVFTGSGTTGAVNHLVYCLSLENIKHVNVFLTPEEHHSNYLPWLEMSRKHKNIHIHIIRIDDNFDLDFEELENRIKETPEDTVNIVSLTACSNVLGIKVDVKKVYNMLQKYNKCSRLQKDKDESFKSDKCCYGNRNLLFVDYACSAPYVKIDARICDALYFSPHKFLGGHSTPGVLIANQELFQNKTPFCPGGNAVSKVCSTIIQYDPDIEKRETAGTPNIIGIIKIRLVLILKDNMLDIIDHNEHQIANYVFCQFDKLMKKYSNLQVILPGCQINNRLPIICINIKELHYNFIVALLSDIYGIQSRGGVSCTNLLAELIETKYNIKGWVRISFNWLMTKEQIDYIIKAVEYILENPNKHKNDYVYDKKKNLYTHKKLTI